MVVAVNDVVLGQNVSELGRYNHYDEVEPLL